MAVLTVSQRYHKFGWAMKRLMSSPNIEADSQTDFAELIERETGYPIDQKGISSYMRQIRVEDEETGRVVERPRVWAPEGFVAALLRLPITDEQREDIISSWVAIQKPDRRDALRQIFAAVNNASASSDAWAEMLDYEADRKNRAGGRGAGDASSGGREEAV